MKYDIINEELRIAAISVNNLTSRQAADILNSWKEDVPLSALTIYRDSDTGLIILNRDNQMYESTLEIVESYLSATVEQRKELREKAPAEKVHSAGIEGILNVLDNALVLNELDMVRKNKWGKLSPYYGKVHRLCGLYKGNYNILASQAFFYGVIVGKRLERARYKNLKKIGGGGY